MLTVELAKLAYFIISLKSYFIHFMDDNREEAAAASFCNKICQLVRASKTPHSHRSLLLHQQRRKINHMKCKEEEVEYFHRI